MHLILPETKDLGLEDIQKYFEPNKSIFRVGTSKVNKKIPTIDLNLTPEIEENEIKNVPRKN